MTWLGPVWSSPHCLHQRNLNDLPSCCECPMSVESPSGTNGRPCAPCGRYRWITRPSICLPLSRQRRIPCLSVIACFFSHSTFSFVNVPERCDSISLPITRLLSYAPAVLYPKHAYTQENPTWCGGVFFQLEWLKISSVMPLS